MPYMAETTRLELRISQELLDQIDDARGWVPRAAWVRSVLSERVAPSSGEPPQKNRPALPQVPASEEAPAADTRATESRVRPASPRGQPKASKRPDKLLETAHTLPKVERRAKASDAMSAALARQQALNKPKGI